MTFHVGQLVVCINDSEWDPGRRKDLWPRLPRKGEVLTVRACFVSGKGVDGLRFEEILCGIHPKEKVECGFQAEHFRPIDRTDISVFTAMLTPVQSTVQA